MKKESAAPDGAEVPASVQDPAKMTPEQWRKLLYPSGTRGQPHPEAWKHAGAAALHQWADYEHHNGKPLLLERPDYEAALKAAEAPVELAGKDDKAPKRSDYVPHPAANGAKPPEGK